MIDSHCHLNDEKLYDRRAAVIETATKAGVSLFLCVGWDLESSEKAIAIANEFPNVYAAIGFQPENLKTISDYALAKLAVMAKDKKVIAIGEIGLDYHWFKNPKDRQNQKIWFAKQIDLANSLKLPISIHAREATRETMAILKEKPPLCGAVLHCYSGSPESLEEFAKMGLYFGFDGPITYVNSSEPRRSVEICPADRLLSETDSPYLSPDPYRGQDNEPAHLKEIVEAMAKIRGKTTQAIEAQIALNFKTLFHVETK